MSGFQPPRVTSPLTTTSFHLFRAPFRFSLAFRFLDR